MHACLSLCAGSTVRHSHLCGLFYLKLYKSNLIRVNIYGRLGADSFMIRLSAQDKSISISWNSLDWHIFMWSKHQHATTHTQGGCQACGQSVGIGLKHTQRAQLLEALLLVASGSSDVNYDHLMGFKDWCAAVAVVSFLCTYIHGAQTSQLESVS